MESFLKSLNFTLVWLMKSEKHGTLSVKTQFLSFDHSKTRYYINFYSRTSFQTVKSLFPGSWKSRSQENIHIYFINIAKVFRDITFRERSIGIRFNTAQMTFCWNLAYL